VPCEEVGPPGRDHTTRKRERYMRWSWAVALVYLTAVMTVAADRDEIAMLREARGSTRMWVSNCEGAATGVFPGDKLELVSVRNYEGSGEYVLQAGDRLMVRFPSLPDYSYEQLVKPDGSINLPRLNSVNVSGKTMDEVYAVVRAKYEQMEWTPEFFFVIQEYDSRAREMDRFFRGEFGQTRRTMAVGVDGFVQLPFIGPVAASGRPVSSIAEDVSERYHQLYPGLTFDVLLAESQGPRLFIFGHVKEPGAYGGILTLPQLLGEAGGPLPLAKMSQTIVMEISGSEVRCRKVNLRRILRGKEDGGEEILCPGTVVYVPTMAIQTLGQLARELSSILFFRGFGLGLNWTWYPGGGSGSGE
jgi:polysaccharide biosynthesis/export protein